MSTINLNLLDDEILTEISKEEDSENCYRAFAQAFQRTVTSAGSCCKPREAEAHHPAY